MRKLLRILAKVLFTAALLLAAAGFFAYRASQQVPEFYEQALQAEVAPEQQQQAGDELERGVLELHNDVRQEGRWEAVFSDAQINGWLSHDMPRKFAELLPPGVSKPRVVVEPDLARIACTYQQKRMRSVISFGLEITVTNEPNVLAVRVRRLRAGMLPLPLKTFLDPIADAAQDAEVTVRWTEVDGDPVALVTVPTEHEQYRRREVYLDTVELRAGEIYLAGRTEQPQVAMVQPDERDERK